MSTWKKQSTVVNGLTMSYVELGEGRPIVFLHGNPTSSYLWRNIAPKLASLGRCVVPDLIGMGDSDKLPESGPQAYRFVQHREYLDVFLEQVGVHEPAIFVVHDWGSALGFDWARRHPDRVRGIAYMEAVVTPMRMEEWSARRIFEAMRSPKGEDLVLENNVFVETILPKSILRPLTEEEMQEYRRPFREPGEARRPTLTWPREMPLDGSPADVVQIVEDYSEWLAGCDIPKLFINAEPGAILIGRMREVCRSWPNQAETTVRGIHFIQEDSPDEIVDAIGAWLNGLDG
jgi:haloalkane dehalogenase